MTKWMRRGSGIALLALGAVAPARAGADASDAAQLRLVVRHALDAGRLVVRVGETAFFSAPIASLVSPTKGEVERLLSIPAGLQTVSVELRDAAGRVVARRQVRGHAVPGTASILDVIASGAPPDSGATALSVDWKGAP